MNIGQALSHFTYTCRQKTRPTFALFERWQSGCKSVALTRDTSFAKSGLVIVLLIWTKIHQWLVSWVFKFFSMLTMTAGIRAVLGTVSQQPPWHQYWPLSIWNTLLPTGWMSVFCCPPPMVTSKDLWLERLEHWVLQSDDCQVLDILEWQPLGAMGRFFGPQSCPNHSMLKLWAIMPLCLRVHQGLITRKGQYY